MTPSSRRTALVVDDDPEIRKMISLFLQRLDFEVTEVGDGRAAVKRLNEVRPTVLCVDLMLPEVSGFDVCEHVRMTPALSGLPILMISARGMPGDRATAEELGVRAYLVKPFTQAKFTEAINKALGEPP